LLEVLLFPSFLLWIAEIFALFNGNRYDCYSGCYFNGDLYYTGLNEFIDVANISLFLGKNDVVADLAIGSWDNLNGAEEGANL